MFYQEVNDKPSDEALYHQLNHLMKCMPNLANIHITVEILKWLGDVYALVKVSNKNWEAGEIKKATNSLIQCSGDEYLSPRIEIANKIQSILIMILSALELKLSTVVQGSLISAGRAFDALAVISKVLDSAKNDILVADPYLNEKVLTDLVIAVKENVMIKLLTNRDKLKNSLEPAYKRWKIQYGHKRPLELRFSPSTFHDKLIIIDDSETWTLTQSLNEFASKSPAHITRVPARNTKIEEYQKIWKNALPLGYEKYD